MDVPASSNDRSDDVLFTGDLHTHSMPLVENSVSFFEQIYTNRA